MSNCFSGSSKIFTERRYKHLCAVMSTKKNIQYEIYNDTKDVLKAVRKENEERLQNQLISQGSFFSSILMIPNPIQLLMVIRSKQTSEKHL